MHIEDLNGISDTLKSSTVVQEVVYQRDVVHRLYQFETQADRLLRYDSQQKPNANSNQPKNNKRVKGADHLYNLFQLV